LIIKEPINEIFTPNPLESIKEITKRYLDTIEQMGYMPKPNLIKHRRLTLPQTLTHLKTQDEREQRQLEYFHRWKNGYENLNGTMYAYNNYAQIHVRAGGGFVRPTYREYTNKTFELMESCLYGHSNYFGDNRGKGIVWLSKRGLGKSAECGHIINSVISVNKETNALVTSKTEDSGIEFLNEKVKNSYYKLPQYMRFSELGNNRNIFHIGKKTKTKDGYTVILGNNSKIITRAPVVESLEGLGAKIWVHDEAGKTKDLLELIDNTLPALNGEDGFTRVGVPIITGVAGDFDKFGQDYIELWDKADARNMIRWFVPGFVGIYTDDLGNDDIERAVYDIFTERYKQYQYNSDTKLAESMQKLPLTPEEALQSSETSIFNKKKLFYQSKVLASNDDLIRKGNLEWNDNRKSVTFYPQQVTGKISILETPQRESFTAQIYIAFLDAYGVQQKQEGSQGAMYVFKRKTRMSDFEQETLFTKLQEAVTIKEKLDIHLRLGYMPVCEYIDNPDDPRIFAEYCSRICSWYHCKILVEREPSPCHIWFLDNAKHLMQRKPLKHFDTNIDFKEYGLKVDEYWKDHRRSFLQHYIEDYCDRIYFARFIKDATGYDDTVQRKKYDSVDALGGCLIHDSQKRLLGSQEEQKDIAPKLFGITKTGNHFKRAR
jgi:hypothetical protein